MHVAFRGTATPLNAAHDVAFLLLPLSDFPALRAETTRGPRACTAASPKWRRTSRTASRSGSRRGPRRTVVLSGHSLGGALAILVGGALKGRGRSIQLCTFGAPPPGDAQYARGCWTACRGLRFANRCDPVPRSLGGADHGGLGGLVDLPMVREYVHVGTHVELEPWSETWRHAVEAVAGRQAGAALATAPAPAAAEPRPAAEPSTAQALWSVLSNSVSNAATRIASKTLEVHSVDNARRTSARHHVFEAARVSRGIARRGQD